MMADILNFTETSLADESIEEYEYHEYDPITGTNAILITVVISELALNHMTFSHILARAA